jgi:RNA polymerase sigma factor (sigma-70 family)
LPPTGASSFAIDVPDALLLRAREGDVQAFSQIYRWFERPVYTLGLRMLGDQEEAMDLLQDAMLKVCRRMGEFRGESPFWGWLRQIAVNEALMRLRKRAPVDFVAEVFGVAETVEARTPMPDGKLIHAQLRLGTVDLMVADRLDGWPARPGLLQLWVSDAAAVLERAGAAGATTVTEPTPFYGETTLARMLDPWQNIWWQYQPAPGQADPVPSWEGGSDTVFTTLDKALRSLG